MVEKVYTRTFSGAERLQYVNRESEQDPGVISVLMKGSDWL